MQPPELGFRPTLGDAVKRTALEFGDADYLVSSNERVTYAQAEERSARLARRMLAAGIGKGTCVGLLFTYGSEWLLFWLAASRIGAVVEPFSTFSTARERCCGSATSTPSSRLLRSSRRMSSGSSRKRVIAVIVPTCLGTYDASVVEQQARNALSAYKVPRRWVTARAEDIPLLPTGKLDRRRLATLV